MMLLMGSNLLVRGIGACQPDGRSRSRPPSGRDSGAGTGVGIVVAPKVESATHVIALAERLPKVLIHHNVAGQPVHELLTAADRAWAAAAGHGVFGPRARWRAMVTALCAEGVPVAPQRRRLRDAVLTVPWATVAPV